MTHFDGRHTISALTVETARAYDAEARRMRAERILDVAGELLLRWGYRRLTMDDVAGEAGIGKGTIYLHWRTREALFQAVLNREVAALLDALRAAVEADPRNALPHRLAGIYFRVIMQRPLVRAVFSMDRDVLGKLWLHEQQREPQLKILRLEFVRFLQTVGVMRSDMSAEELTYIFRTVLLGFFLADQYSEEVTSLDRKADLVGMMIRGAVGVADEPSEEVAAMVGERVLDLLKEASAGQLMAQLTRRD